MPGVRVHCAPGGLVELVQNNPLPSIHGRVCYHPCETVCNRALTDSAVSIHAVERFLGDLANGLMQQKLATASGYWPLIRYNPALRAAGKKPFVLDSPRPSIPLKDYAYNEMRYRILTQTYPQDAEKLMQSAQELVQLRWQTYEHMAKQEPAKFQPGS